MAYGYMSDPDSIEVRERVGNKIWRHLFEQKGKFLDYTRNDSCVDAWIAAKFLGWDEATLRDKIKEYYKRVAKDAWPTAGDEEVTEWIESKMVLLDDHIIRIAPYAERWDDLGVLLDKMVDSAYAQKLRNYIELLEEDE